MRKICFVLKNVLFSKDLKINNLLCNKPVPPRRSRRLHEALRRGHKEGPHLLRAHPRFRRRGIQGNRQREYYSGGTDTFNNWQINGDANSFLIGLDSLDLSLWQFLQNFFTPRTFALRTLLNNPQLCFCFLLLANGACFYALFLFVLNSRKSKVLGAFLVAKCATSPLQTHLATDGATIGLRSNAAGGF